MAQWRPAGAPAARFAVALAAAAVPLTLAPFLEHPERAAETAYLGLLAALLLMTLAALPAPGRRPDALAPAALLAVLALVALPPGPVRGLALSALLAAAVALALAQRLAAPARSWLRETAVLVPAAVAVQVLFRADGLLAPAADLHTLVVYGVLPPAAAAAAAFLAVRHGRAPVLIAAAGAVLLGGGFHVVSTLALVAVAAGELLARPPSGRPRAWRAAAVLVLVAPFAWQQRTAGLALLTGLATAALTVQGDGERPAWKPLAQGAVLVAAVGAALALPLHPWADAASALALGLLLLPLLPWRLIRDARWAPRRLAGALVGVALALAAARCAPDVSALALPLALLCLVVARPDGPGETLRHGVVLQGGWSAVLTLVAALLAGYPWLRPQPAAASLDLLRLDATGWSALVLVALATAAALWPGPPPFRRVQAPVLAGLLLLHAVPATPPPRPLIEAPGVELSRAAPSVEREIGPAAPGHPISTLVAHSHLSYATPLPAGTPVFDLLLFAGGEEPVARWTFRTGVETAEWAARRDDAAAALAHPPPAPHVVWVAPGGGFFGQSYRARHELPRGVEARRLVLRRRADLPPAVTVHLERLEAAP